MRERAAIVDGEEVPESQAAVPIDNPSFLSGYGVFDTLHVLGGQPVFWAEHLARLKSGALRLGIEWPAAIDALPERIPRLAKRNVGDQEAALRITLAPSKLESGGPSGAFWLATVRPIPERSLRKRKGVHGAILRGGIRRPLPEVKSTSYVAPYLPLPRGANEWILVNRAGKILEGGSSNLFIESGGRLISPPVSSGLLPGIVRAWVFGRAAELGIDVRQRTFSETDFLEADGAMVTASLTGLAPWLSLDGQAGPGWGKIGRRIERDYRRAIGRKR